VAEQEQIITLLEGVLPAYSDIATILETIPGALTLNEVVNRLLGAELRVKRQNESISTSEKILVAATSPPSKDEDKDGKGKWKEKRSCFYCGKAGHPEKECRKLKTDKATGRVQPHVSKDGQVSNFVLQVCGTGALTHGEWCIDSGASKHMCAQREYFKSLRPIMPEKVFIADGTPLLARDGGHAIQILAQRQRD